MEPSMDSYSEFIEELAAGNSVAINRRAEHAGVILRALFNKARHQVYVLSNFLDPDIYDREVGYAAAGFLLEHTTAELSILLEQDVRLRGHAFFSGFFSGTEAGTFFNRFEIRQVPSEVQKAYEFNFVVADGEHFRFERNRSSSEAIVQFSNPKSGAFLKRVFEQLKEASVIIAAPGRSVSNSAQLPIDF
jgi:hypothetical protein